MKFNLAGSFLLLLLLGCAESEKKRVSYSEEAVNSPQLFAPGVISTSDHNEFDLCFTPDGKTIYFTRRFPGEKQKIYTSTLAEGQWSAPVLAPFSTDRDETPFITPDGNTLYFGSQREIPGKPNLGGFDMNVWKVEKTPEGWSEPEPLPDPVNKVQIEGENWPSSVNNYFFTLDGITFYYTTMERGSAGIDVYKTTKEDKGFSLPERIEGLFENDSLWKYSASLSPDGEFMVFNVYDGPGGFGGDDLYVSKKTSSGWSGAVNMGEIVNSAGEEGSGRFSPDGRYFFFTHTDPPVDGEYEPWSIYFLETEFLNLQALLKEQRSGDLN
ncbi:PD40 domain-containing protein [Muriicola marianensis]|nr:PD40 domain-containing protein [Muriicola marianensis]